MSSRILAFAPCSRCRERRRVERAVERAKIEALRIEQIVGTDVIEFYVPNAERVLNPREDDDDEEVGIEFMVALKPRVASFDESLTQYTVDELRRFGSALLAAADAVEVGAA